MAHLFLLHIFFSVLPRPSSSTLFPYTTLFRSVFWTHFGSVSSTHANSPSVTRQICLVLRRILTAGLTNPLVRSEEHTSELQSRGHLVCRLLLEKKNNEKKNAATKNKA